MPSPGQHPPPSEQSGSLTLYLTPEVHSSPSPAQSPRGPAPGPSRALDAVGRAGSAGPGSPAEQQQGQEQQQERPAPPSPPATVSTYGLTAHLSGGWLWRVKDARKEAQEQEQEREREAGQGIRAVAGFV